MPIRVTTTKTLTCSPVELDVNRLTELLHGSSPEARVSVHVSPGDAREPSEVRITVTEETRV